MKSTIYTSFILLIFILTVNINIGKAQEYQSTYHAFNSGSLVRDKNFYLFNLFDRIPDAFSGSSEIQLFSSLYKEKMRALKKASDTCGENSGCHVEALRWSETEIASIANELAVLAKKSKVFSALIHEHMRKSGMFERYADSTDGVLLAGAWKDAARAMNRIMDVYALGRAPRYPLIDSASYDVSTLIYRKNINLVIKTMIEVPEGLKSFYDPALRFSLDLLELNMRDEAGRFEPLDSVNRSAVEELRNIQWDHYPYSAIVIPGAGPDIERAAIDPWAISRLRIAVDRFRKGKAPIFIVSGGFVKPFQTPFCEGMEMKRYLMEHFHIPAERIILEPFARHTTTNIRNASRLIFRYGIPPTKKALIITDWYQSKTIQSDSFKQRCLDELGYLPFTFLSAKSPVDTEFTPSIISMHNDAMDPMDP